MINPAIVLADGGLGGHSDVHHQFLWLAVVAVFVVGVVALVWVYRRSSNQLELERAEEILRREDVLP